MGGSFDSRMHWDRHGRAWAQHGIHIGTALLPTLISLRAPCLGSLLVSWHHLALLSSTFQKPSCCLHNIKDMSIKLKAMG